MLLNPEVLLLWESLRLPCVCHALNRISGGLKGNQNIERPDSLLSSRGRDFYAGLDRADPVDRWYDMIWYMVWCGVAWWSVADPAGGWEKVNFYCQHQLQLSHHTDQQQEYTASVCQSISESKFQCFEQIYICIAVHVRGISQLTF